MIQKRAQTPKPLRFWYYATSILVLLRGLRPSAGLLSLLVRSEAANPIPVRLRRSGLRFLAANRLDVWTIKEVCLDRDYERAGAHPADGWVVLDVGAGIGEFAIDLASRLPLAVVHAFEPSPAAHALLRRNIEANEVANVRAYPFAIAPATGRVRLDVSSPLTALHRLALPDAEVGSTIEVESWTLERALTGLDAPRCDLLKLDCEGGEYEILLTASRQTLDRIDRVCLEYHDGPDHTHRDLVERLTAAGFSVRLLASRAYQEIGFLYAWKTSSRLPDLHGN